MYNKFRKYPIDIVVGGIVHVLVSILHVLAVDAALALALAVGLDHVKQAY